MTEKRRYNAKRIFGSLLWALLGLATVVLLGAAMNLKDSKHCRGVNIIISGTQNNFFIDKKEINNILETLSGGSLTGKALASFNLASIENTLRKDQWIKNAELYFDNNEVLRVNVAEREPIARIFTTAGSSFYIDTALAKLPLSDKFSARVPMFSDFVSTSNSFTKDDSILLNDIKNLGSYILGSSFWMAQIDQIDITPNRTFEMIPKIGNQIIAFGNADDYEQKFNKLLTFYQQVESKVGWNKYSRIDVEYKDQIVAVKRGAGDIIQDSLRTKQLMQMLVANAQKAANDSINNIQLEQPKDDNSVPVATQVDDLPDEHTTTVKPIIVTPNIPIQPSTERPTPNLNSDPAPAKNTVPPTTKVIEKTVAPEKSIIPSNAKPFWLASVPAKTSGILKRTAAIKNNSTSHERSNPIPIKRAVTKPTIKVVNKAAAKTIKPPTKAVTKSTIKPIAKPKKEAPPSNDY
jgi:cell division protein FtsQ